MLSGGRQCRVNQDWTIKPSKHDIVPVILRYKRDSIHKVPVLYREVGGKNGEVGDDYPVHTSDGHLS